MQINDAILVKATAKQMLVDLRIAQGGLTAELKEERELVEGQVATIREVLEAKGDRLLRPEQIQQQAIEMVFAKTGRTPNEIAELLTSDKKETVHRTENGVQARIPKSFGAPRGDKWTRMMGDFVYFCEMALEIPYRPGLNPDFPLGGYGAFSPNEHQIKIIAVLIDDWMNDMPVRDIILKARQLGITTILLGFWMWLIMQKGHFVVMFIIDKDPHMYEKRDMLIRWAEKISESYPDAPALSARGGKRLVWSNGSKILFESSQSPNPGTSERIDAIHLSEMPKWVKGRAQQVEKSLFPGIPDAPNTFIVNESTAEGMGHFFKRWNRVMNGQEVGETRTKPLFLPWHLSSEYARKPLAQDYDLDGKFIFLDSDREVCEMDDYGEIILTEEQYAHKHELSIEQVYWRRLQIKNKFQGDQLNFNQEFPTTPDHAWSAFGKLFFGMQCSLECTARVEEPVITGHIIDQDGNNDPSRLFSWSHYKPVVVKDRNGPLQIYGRPLTSRKYYIGGDIAEGKQVGDKADPDYTVLYVLDNAGAVVAQYRGRVKPEEVAHPAILLGIMYNVAQINIERNSVGEATWAMFKQSGYNNVYVRSGNGPYVDRAWNKTTKSNRKTMLTEMRQHLRRHPDHCVSKDLAREISMFVTNPDGKPEAMLGEHDDCVMAYCHGYHMVYDVVGVRVKVIEEEEAAPEDLEFFNVLEHNGIYLGEDYAS
tara:strand:- start:5081 stop:7204 length:2124 start_codon:yes stop_codon:yes gene_type:complete